MSTVPGFWDTCAAHPDPQPACTHTNNVNKREMLTWLVAVLSTERARAQVQPMQTCKFSS